MNICIFKYTIYVCNFITTNTVVRVHSFFCFPLTTDIFITKRNLYELLHILFLSVCTNYYYFLNYTKKKYIHIIFQLCAIYFFGLQKIWSPLFKNVMRKLLNLWITISESVGGVTNIWFICLVSYNQKILLHTWFVYYSSIF